MSGLHQKPINFVLRFFRSDVHASLKMMMISIACAVIFISPLLVYIVVGPSDGNPIGLGLLAVAGVVLGKIGLGIGAVWFLCSLFFGSNRG
jgi:ABC-type Co2+ transport system permease subunit